MIRRLRLLLVGVLLVEASWFLYTQTNGILIKEQQIRVSRLAHALEGIRVVQISDLHVRRFGAREKRLVELIREVNPGVIFVTGDLIDYNGGIEPCAELFRQITPGRQVIAVLGNNDHSYKKKQIDTGRLVEAVHQAGVCVLRNESAVLRVVGTQGELRRCYVVGLDDNFLWLDDIFRAARGVPKNEPVILLAHTPSIVEKIDTTGIDLILSGHTHGGQIALPCIGALYTNPVAGARKKFSSGLYVDDTLVYVNPGIGTGSVPFRLFARPEITVFNFSE